jgi:poly-beta-hydroxyalkanoate depolymerase
VAYPKELLESAVVACQVTPQTQATLRRAVSTAYYALFHFMIDEACRNWSRAEQRHRLARVFEHKQMADASNRCLSKYASVVQGSTEWHLRSVAYSFQSFKKSATRLINDLSVTLSGGDVAMDILSVENAFTSWGIIQNEQIARDYLYSLLFKER